MIALEALKNEVHDITEKLSYIVSHIDQNTHVIEVNSAALATNNQNLNEMFATYNHDQDILHHLQDVAHESEYAIYENRHALVLYCQQFAFAPEMAGPCADLLSCGDR